MSFSFAGVNGIVAHGCLVQRSVASATIVRQVDRFSRREEIETMQTLPASAEQCLGLASAATCEEAGCQVAAVRLCVARSALYAVVLIS